MCKRSEPRYKKTRFAKYSRYIYIYNMMISDEFSETTTTASSGKTAAASPPPVLWRSSGATSSVSRKRRRVAPTAARRLDFGDDDDEKAKPDDVPEEGEIEEESEKEGKRRPSVAALQERFEGVEREYRRLRMELEQQPEVRHYQSITDDCKRRACVTLFRRWARFCFQQLLLPSPSAQRVADVMCERLDIGGVIRLPHWVEFDTQPAVQKMWEIFEDCLGSVWHVQAYADPDPAGGGRHARHELVLLSDRNGARYTTVSEHRYGAVTVRHPKERARRAAPEVQVVAQVLMESGVALAWIVRELHAIMTGTPAPGDRSDLPLAIPDDEEESSSSDSEAEAMAGY